MGRWYVFVPEIDGCGPYLGGCGCLLILGLGLVSCEAMGVIPNISRDPSCLVLACGEDKLLKDAKKKQLPDDMSTSWEARGKDWTFAANIAAAQESYKGEKVRLKLRFAMTPGSCQREASVETKDDDVWTLRSGNPHIKTDVDQLRTQWKTGLCSKPLWLRFEPGKRITVMVATQENSLDDDADVKKAKRQGLWKSAPLTVAKR